MGVGFWSGIRKLQLRYVFFFLECGVCVVCGVGGGESETNSPNIYQEPQLVLPMLRRVGLDGQQQDIYIYIRIRNPR